MTKELKPVTNFTEQVTAASLVGIDFGAAELVLFALLFGSGAKTGRIPSHNAIDGDAIDGEYIDLDKQKLLEKPDGSGNL